MPTWLVSMLVKLQIQSKPNNPFVFLTEDRWEIVQMKWSEVRTSKNIDKWFNRDICNNLLRNFKNYCRNSGIKTDENEKITIHCLRKSYAQNLASNNVPMATLKDLMGHSSIRCTEQYYLKSSTPNQLAAVEVLNGLVEVG